MVSAKAPVMDFHYVYETFCDKVYRTAYKVTRDTYLAEDVVQETFVKAYHKLDTIMDTDKIGGWLSAIALRTAIDLIRKENKTPIILDEEGIRDGQYPPSSGFQWEVERAVEEHWLEQEIEQKIARLKPGLQEVFLLKYKHGYKEEEITERLHLPKGTVKSRLYRARQQLKLEMTKEFIPII